MNKHIFPRWVIILLITLSVAAIGAVSLSVYLIFNPKVAAVPSKAVGSFVVKKISTLGHSMYLNSIQDPDKDKDGLEDSVAETLIYKTDPNKFDSASLGVGDGEYVYNVYRKAFGNNDESNLEVYRKNLSAYDATLKRSGLSRAGTLSLSDSFNLRALQTYNFYVGVPDDVIQVVRQALTLRQSADYTGSYKLLQSALVKYPDSVILKYHMGLTYHGLKQYDKALAIYLSIQDDPGVQSPLLYSDIAVAYYFLGNTDKYVEYMQSSIQIFPEDLSQYLKLATYYQSVNQLDAAEKILNEGIKIEPRYAEYYNALSIIAHLKGDLQGEQRLCEQAIFFDFRYAPAHENLSILYEEVNNDIKGALVEARIALELDATPYHVSRVMMLYAKLNQFAQAQKYETKLLSLKNIDGTSYNSLGLMYLDRKNYTQAEVYFRKAIVLDQTLPNPYNNLGITLDSLSRPDEALTYFKKAIVLNPNYANAYSNMGVIYTEKKQYSDSIAAQKKAIEINPHIYRYYNNLGYAYMQINEKALAIESFKTALELGSTDPTTKENLKFLGVTGF